MAEQAPPPPPEDGAPERTAPEKAGTGPRVLAVIAALMLGVLVGAFTAAAIDGLDLPTCQELREKQESGDCADASKTANDVSDVTLLAAAGAAILGTLALFAFGFTGRRRWVRRTLVLLGLAVALFGLTAVITRV